MALVASDAMCVTVGWVLDELPTWWMVLFGGVLGTVLASFLAVVAERVPRGESINGRSHCVCGRQLLGRENIPVIGWLAARGTSRCCAARIPVRYVVGEISLGATWALGALLRSPATIVVWVVSGALLVAVSWRR